MARPNDYRTAVQTARSLGLTVRALRVYERHGLVKPGRTPAGWRVYGPDEMARLHQIVALKRLGLPLAKIAGLLGGRAIDLDGLLAAQEEALLASRDRTERALDVIRRARARLARGEPVPTEDLIQLTQETAMTEMKPGPEFQAIVAKHGDMERVKELHPGGWSAEDQVRVEAEWKALKAEAEALKDGDPGSPAALDLARRWKAQVEKFTMGDPDLLKRTEAIWREAAADPVASQQVKQWLPSPEVSAFLAKARAKLAEGDTAV